MKTVIEMAREAGMVVIDDQYSLLPFLERFAEIVRSDEREAIIDLVAMYGGTIDLEAAIRARGNT